MPEICELSEMAPMPPSHLARMMSDTPLVQTLSTACWVLVTPATLLEIAQRLFRRTLAVAASMVASWELDLFGGERRSVEAASATRDAVAADLTDAQLALAASVGDWYAAIVQHRRDLKDAALAAEDAAALDAIDVTTGWPE